MTIQAELKKQAYSSNLKSRALSILIYLIDRSNKELTCFPAIPTMAEQLHISISTVKRGLKELVDAGFVEKDVRFRENNRGQTSNLYTLVLSPRISIPDNDNNLNLEDNIDTTAEPVSRPATHITFETLQAEQQKLPTREAAVTESAHEIDKKANCKRITPVQIVPLKPSLLQRLMEQAKEKAGHFLPCNSSFYWWTGVEVNLIPP